jgi:hypothetical protein
MPAIQPARLKKQVEQLASYFNQPNVFLRKFNQLMEYYAERVQRPGQSGEPSPLIKSYKVRPPVMRQIVFTLTPLVKEQPEAAITLGDALWQENNLESRLLAAAVLGNVSPEYQEMVLDRIPVWAESEREDRIIDSLLTDGLSGLREQDVEKVVALIEEWLQSGDLHQQRLGLQALLNIAEKQNFNNPPLIYRLLQPYILVSPPELHYFVIQLLRALAVNSPNETAYYLYQSLSHPESKDTAWLIRQCIDCFPSENQPRLRDAVRKKRESR